MKRIISRMLILLLFCIVTSACADETTLYVLCEPGSEVNVRTTASTKSTTEGWLTLGDAVSVDEEKEDSTGRDWFHCIDLSTEAGNGWVCAYYLVKTTVTIETYEGTVRADGRVAARRWPNGERKNWLKEGVELTVYAQTDEWAITNRGYVKVQFIERKENAQ
ncbi:MAG: SH3 domain-containing protein [Eubacteriales bacterium]|nr:SH3 domain-containing protein [Eubacteriales bacterium]